MRTVLTVGGMLLGVASAIIPAHTRAGNQYAQIVSQAHSIGNVGGTPGRRVSRKALRRTITMAVFVSRHGEREDYQWKVRGDNWIQQAERWVLFGWMLTPGSEH